MNEDASVKCPHSHSDQYLHGENITTGINSKDKKPSQLLTIAPVVNHSLHGLPLVSSTSKHTHKHTHTPALLL